MKTNENRITKLASTRPFRQVSDRRVRRELRRATLHAALAARRARDIGAARATGDRRVTRGFQRSSLHAVRALSFSINPPPSHRVRNTVLIVTGADPVGPHLSRALVGGVVGGEAASGSPRFCYSDGHSVRGR